MKKMSMYIGVAILSIIVSILIRKPVFLVIVGMYLIRYIYRKIFNEKEEENEK